MERAIIVRGSRERIELDGPVDTGAVILEER
jgi:hypothetical protein